MLILDHFSPLISYFEDKGFVLVLGKFVLIFEDTLDDLSVKGLVFADALLDIHDDLAVGLLKRFLFCDSGVWGIAFGSRSQVLISGIGQGPNA